MKHNVQRAVRPYLTVFAAAAMLSLGHADDAGEAPPVPLIEETQSGAPLPEYVVVAHRLHTPLAQASPSVNVISGEMLQAQQLTTLSQALAEVPGMSLAQTGQVGALTTLFTRGTNSNNTTILLDGRRLNPGLSRFYNVGELTTDNLASIEIMRGASSTLYGAEGIGGVIDLRSRSALGQQGASGTIAQEYGSNDYWRTTFAAEAAEGDFAATIGGSYRETRNRQPNSRFRESYLLPRFDWRINEHFSVDLVGLYLHSRVGNPSDNRSIAYPDIEGFTQMETWLVSPRLTYANGDGWSAQVFYARSEDRTLGLNVSPGFRNDTQSRVVSDQIDVQVNYEWSQQWIFTVGGGYNHYGFHQINRNSGAVNFDQNWSDTYLWGQANWNPTEALSLWAGVRFAQYSEFNNPVTYDFQGSYRIAATATTFFAKVATAYSAPTPNQVNFAPPGNPQLESEHSLSWELGVKQEIPGVPVTASALFFQNRIRNLLDNTGPPDYFAINVNRARTEGIELQLSWTPYHSLEFFANYTYLHAVSESDQMFGPQQGERLYRRPRNSGTVGLVVRPNDRWTLGGSVTAASDRMDVGNVELSGCIVGRAFAAWKVHRHLEVFGRVENLFDDGYQLAAGYPALPVSLYGGIRLSF